MWILFGKLWVFFLANFTLREMNHETQFKNLQMKGHRDIASISSATCHGTCQRPALRQLPRGETVLHFHLCKYSAGRKGAASARLAFFLKKGHDRKRAEGGTTQIPSTYIGKESMLWNFWGNNVKICHPLQAYGLTKSPLEQRREVAPCTRWDENEINGEFLEGNLSTLCYLPSQICRQPCVCHKQRRKARSVAIPLRLPRVNFIKMIKCFGSWQPPGLTAGWTSWGIKGWRRWAHGSSWHVPVASLVSQLIEVLSR